MSQKAQLLLVFVLLVASMLFRIFDKNGKFSETFLGIFFILLMCALVLLLALLQLFGGGV